jgi:hypothetical protein
MNIRRPVLIVILIGIISITQGGNIVGQGINPYIDDMLVIKCNRNTPLEAGSGYTQILQTGVDEIVHHFIDTGIGIKEICGCQKLAKTVRKSRKLEEISFFPGINNFSAAVRALAVHQLALSPEALARGAVLAHILALINITSVVQILENLLYSLYMIIISRADKTVILDIDEVPELFEIADDSVNIFLGSKICNYRIDIIACLLL